MDYNVFLLSRIREAYQEGDSPRDAVVHGLSRIGKLVLVAGAIMASVFAGFMLTPDLVIKQMGFALAVAIVIDVLVVRMLLAPAVVTLLGHHAWRLPRWLDRILPEIHLEGEPAADPEPTFPPDEDEDEPNEPLPLAA
jgi:RND superfamily putative drug exporter